MPTRELSREEIERLIDPELAAQLSTTLTPNLPDGVLSVALVRELDERLQLAPG